MELRQYWKIIWRRRWVVIGLTLFTAAVSALLGLIAQPSYAASTRMVISMPPEEKTVPYFTYDRYYNWVSGEYLVDDFVEILKSDVFLQDVKAELGDEAIGKGAIQGSRPPRTHHLLTLTVTAKDAEQTKRVAEAAVRVIERKGKEYLAQLQYGDATIEVIDPPSVSRQGGSLRPYLDLAVRTALGFILALALVFFLHYVSDTIHEAKEAEELLGLPVLGEIPSETKGSL